MEDVKWTELAQHDPPFISIMTRYLVNKE